MRCTYVSPLLLSKQKLTMANKNQKNTKFAAPKADLASNNQEALATLQAQNQQLATLAQESFNRLLFVENRLSPQLLRKPNFLNILFHWKELIAVIVEVIDIIKKFREQLNAPKTNDTNQ